MYLYVSCVVFMNIATVYPFWYLTKCSLLHYFKMLIRMFCHSELTAPHIQRLICFWPCPLSSALVSFICLACLLACWVNAWLSKLVDMCLHLILLTHLCLVISPIGSYRDITLGKQLLKKCCLYLPSCFLNNFFVMSSSTRVTFFSLCQWKKFRVALPLC